MRAGRSGWAAVLATAGIATLALYGAGTEQEDESPFSYDASAVTVGAEALGTPDAYDADVVTWKNKVWQTWLEFRPGEGDAIQLAVIQRGKRVLHPVPLGGFTDVARPTLTRFGNDLLLTAEVRGGTSGTWDLAAWLFLKSGDCRVGPRLLASGDTEEVHHAVAWAGGHSGRVWVAAQQSGQSSFDIAVTGIHKRDLLAGDANAPFQASWQRMSHSPRGDWHPDMAVTPDGDVCLVWDSFDGTSHGIRARWYRRAESSDRQGAWQPTLVVSDRPSFEGRARVACDAEGRAWVAWEEGGTDWGRPFRGEEITWDNCTDGYGPLHRYRRVHLAVVTQDGQRLEPPPLPQESFARAVGDPDRRPDTDQLGVYYERPELVIDREGTPWLFVRHFQDHQLARTEDTKHHVEQGWRIDARALGAEGWSDPISLSQRQRDGMQRLSLTSTRDGVDVVWTAGRTDRRSADAPLGVFRSHLKRSDLKGYVPGPPALTPGKPLTMAKDLEVPPRAPRPTTTVGDQEYTLVFGDLHRHTDLSLCFPFYDGSLDDAYRYAMDVAELDFLGITDHTRDIAQGNALSLLWHRCVREVDRHDGVGGFTAFYSYERSQGHTDHNVISLRPDMLRPHQPPLTDFWAEITDGRTFTIPHATSRNHGKRFIGKVWEYQDEQRRPLVEVYQGYRDADSLEELQTPLKNGQRLGFIASSDHLSTSASYACAWTTDTSREGIFRALKDRRTYGATDRMQLRVTHGDQWMGEVVRTDGPLLLDVEVTGTGPLAEIRVFRDGELHQHMECEGQEAWNGRLEVPFEGPGPHYAYVEVHQEDGHRAWSSPLWWESTQEGSSPR